MYENESIQRSKMRTYEVLFKKAKQLICNLLTQNPLKKNNSLGRWMYENGSIQRSNIRTYELVFK